MKGPNGGVTGGEGAIPNSGQWEKGVCGVRRDGVWGGGVVGAFGALMQLFLC